MCDNLTFRTAPPKVWLVDACASETVYAPGSPLSDRCVRRSASTHARRTHDGPTAERPGPSRDTEAQWLCHADRMQWHWGNIGSMLAGLSTILIAVAALIRGPAVVRSWLGRAGP
jgi:hypothetical protein